MRKNLDSSSARAAATSGAGAGAGPTRSVGGCLAPPGHSADGAAAGSPARLRTALATCVARLGQGHMPVRVGPPGDARPRGAGHFHLVPELFLQLGGTTQFRFPHGALTLQPGEALLVPPQLRHDERVKAGVGHEPFSNLVVCADGAALSCHLAHEARPGRPGILYLESSRHPHAQRVHDWLAEAARLGSASAVAPQGDGASGTGDWAATQVRALVAAATAGVLRTLDDATAAPAEPPLLARLRVLVHNQLGDAALSVAGLAAQSGVTADYLSHLFRRHSGEALVACINRLRLDRAERLLRETTLAVKEIAWACGFASPSYFIRSFRGRHGCTPRAWRAATGSTAALAR